VSGQLCVPAASYYKKGLPCKVDRKLRWPTRQFGHSDLRQKFLAPAKHKTVSTLH